MPLIPIEMVFHLDLSPLSRTIGAALVGAGSAGLLIPRWIRYMKQEGHVQPIRSAEVSELKGLHSEKKSTPTMGGLILLIATLLGAVLFADWAILSTWITGAVVVLFGALGACDDLMKVFRRSYRGIAGSKKLYLELLLGALLAWFVLGGAGEGPGVTFCLVPFWGPLVSQGIVSLCVMGGVSTLALAGTANAVNLTDGLDGLASGLLLLCFGTFAYCSLQGAASGVSESCAAWAGGAAGACFAFLWFNSSPAQIFMGDTGSLGLGGLLGVLCILLRMELFLPILGAIFVAEALSVMIQVAYFRRTGRRVFRCAPIHHHFEMGGVPEPRLVIRFWMVQLLLCGITVWAFRVS